MKMILRFIFVVSIIKCVQCLCGPPGESRQLKVDSLTEETNDTQVAFFNYPEGAEILYSCVNKSHLLFGSATRKCINGHWTHRIPHCLSKIDSTLYTVVVEVDKITVSFMNATEMGAFKIAMASEDLKIVDASTFRCDSVNASLICISDQVKNVENLSVRFDKQLNPNDTFEFFEFVDDACELPDVPAFANIEVQDKCKITDNCTRFIYKCLRTFSLQPANYENVNCETAGEKIPLCVPNDLCAKLPTDNIMEQKYSSPWNETHFLPEAVVTYKCKRKDDILLGEASRRCSRNGIWSGEPPVCDFNPRNGSVPLAPASSKPDLFNIPMLIALCTLVFGTVLVVFILIIVIHKRNQRIAQLQRLGSLRSRNFYFDVPIQTKPSYKHGTRVDDNIGLTSSDYNMDANRDTAIFYTKEMVDNRYSRTTDRFSLPSNGYQYDMSGNLPTLLVTDDPTIPQISL